MDTTLLRIVHERLDQAKATGDWPYFVLAACEGPSALAQLLGGGRAAADSQQRLSDILDEPDEAPGAYLQSITIEGFRGIGPRQTLDVLPGPGLTLIAGRNGSGKSSFAEGLEILLTGANWRWVHRSKVWQQGWRNLHHAERVEVAAEFAVEGEPGSTRLSRTWINGAELTDSRESVLLPSGGRTTIEEVGWAAAAETYRPLLSYNELGAMFEGRPTEFHDALAAILGLGDLDAAARLLRDERIARERALDATKASLAGLLARLAETDDARARKTLAALSGRTWDIGAAEAVLVGQGPAGQDGQDLGLLRELAGLPAPDEEAVLEATEQARLAIAALAAIAGTPAGDARRLAGLLRDALHYHGAHGDGDCPICGRKAALDAAWRSSAESEVDRLSVLATEAEEAERLGREAMHRLALVLSSPPAVLDRTGLVGIDGDAARTAWSRYADAPRGDLAALAEHLDETVGPLRHAVDEVRRAAAAELARREDVWRPLARDLAAWLPSARKAVDGGHTIADLKKAETWLKSTGSQIRAQRFAPIAESARGLWELLRTASSVELERVFLEGTGPMRRVTVDVTVDGIEGAALGVMSQGELHAMALSLFLPRATLPESPFRFVVIDDPVQSMDPARVDGLARVLGEVARSRQVVVFTHDDRLRESVRRLGIDARVIEVTRREGSVVELRAALDPVARNLDDADAIARTPELPALVARQTVPGFCRAAIEAACIEVIRRRRIGAGEPHAEVEQLLEGNPSLNARMALALWDDARRGGEVATRVQSWGEGLADAWGISNRGAHSGYGGDLAELVRNARILCRRVREAQ
jgi:recombinational DNA repair ATPase RecF